jgi:HCOMODA/2-hydroxy-3-carboxy-muconic semialdehyde decarboxylase
LGEISFLNEEEAKLSSDMNDGQIPRSWNLWVARLGQIDIGA